MLQTQLGFIPGRVLAMTMIICLTICARVSQARESYFSRPKIEEVQARAHDLGSDWQKVKRAQVGYVALMLELYPGDHYYLARDMEYAYDLAKLMTANTPDAGRVHLLNVSRMNVKDANLKNYLAQEGLTSERILAGRPLTMLDSAYSASIVDEIRRHFEAAASAKIKAHLIASRNTSAPPTRSFLIHLNPAVNDRPPLSLNTAVSAYESMPRFTDRSTSYAFENGRWAPISSEMPIDEDGSISKELTLRYMEDLKADALDPKVRAEFDYQRNLARQVIQLMTSKNAIGAKDQLRKQLEGSQGSRRAQLIALIRDIAGAGANANLSLQVRLEDLGLKRINDYAPAEMTKLYDLALAYPEWETILEEPHSEIRKLFASKDWSTIGALIDADVSPEVNEILAKRLFDAPATGMKRSLQVAMIRKKDQFVLGYLASDIFSRPQAAEMKDLVKLAIENSGKLALDYFDQYVVNEPHFKSSPDLRALLKQRQAPTPVSCRALF